jgi:MFS family permease
MDRLYRTTGWGCAWGSAFGALFGGILDCVFGTSGLIALLLAGIASLLGSYFGFGIGSKHVKKLSPETPCPPEVLKFHKQHGAMWSLMGAMVGGSVGSIVGAGVAAAGCALCMYHMPATMFCMPSTMMSSMNSMNSGMMMSMSSTMMNSMVIVNVIMAGGMGGMTGGVIGAWLSAVRAGFVGAKKDADM